VYAVLEEVTVQQMFFVICTSRETEYLFVSAEGHRQLLSTASADRLAIISLHRGHNYEGGLAAVKEELAPCIVQLAPPGLPPNFQVFLKIFLAYSNHYY
jgi:hypothetical protein